MGGEVMELEERGVVLCCLRPLRRIGVGLRGSVSCMRLWRWCREGGFREDSLMFDVPLSRLWLPSLCWCH